MVRVAYPPLVRRHLENAKIDIGITQVDAAILSANPIDFLALRYYVTRVVGSEKPHLL